MKNKILVIGISLLFNLSCDRNKENKKDVSDSLQKVEVVLPNIDSFDKKNDPFLKKEKENKLEYKIVGEIKSDLNKDGEIDELKVYNYKGWEESEPGDFRKIEIKTKGEYVIKNVDSWVKLSNLNLNKALLEFKTDNNNYYVSLDIGFRNPVIVCFGYWYADIPGFVSVFSVDDKEPKLVFNKPFHVKKVEKTQNTNYNKLIGVYNNEDYELIMINGALQFNKI